MDGGFQGNRELPAGLHGVDGIENEVDDALLELIEVSPHRWDVRVHRRRQANILQLEFMLA